MELPITQKITVINHEATGAALKKKREAAHLTQMQVSAAAKISPSYLCDLENGRRDFDTDLVTAIETAIERERLRA